MSGEHVFAADPDGTAEDDGWLMSFVTDRETEQSELVILDARDVGGRAGRAGADGSPGPDRLPRELVRAD